MTPTTNVSSNVIDLDLAQNDDLPHPVSEPNSAALSLLSPPEDDRDREQHVLDRPHPDVPTNATPISGDLDACPPAGSSRLVGDGKSPGDKPYLRTRWVAAATAAALLIRQERVKSRYVFVWQCVSNNPSNAGMALFSKADEHENSALVDAHALISWSIHAQRV